MIRTTCRRSTKARHCYTCGYLAIRRGDLYLEHVASPHHDDLGNQGWWRLPECEGCAVNRGRAHLFDNRVSA